MGAEHPFLSRPADHRPGVTSQTHMERVVRAKRGAVLHAATRGAVARRRRPARVAHVCRPRRGLHGSHSHLPGAGREAQGPTCRLGRIQLHQSHRALHVR